MNQTQTRGRTDGMKRRRLFNASPAGDSAAELEDKALRSAQEVFGEYAKIEMADDYAITDRFPDVTEEDMLHDPSKRGRPRYRGCIRVYELVPDPERGGWFPA